MEPRSLGASDYLKALIPTILGEHLPKSSALEDFPVHNALEKDVQAGFSMPLGQEVGPY